jgi:hypothetical protein
LSFAVFLAIGQPDCPLHHFTPVIMPPLATHPLSGDDHFSRSGSRSWYRHCGAGKNHARLGHMFTFRVNLGRVKTQNEIERNEN